MENLSALNTKCLANMPMLLESICTTTTKLAKILSPYYDSLKKELEQKGYNITDKVEREAIYVLGHNEEYKFRGLSIYYIKPDIMLKYLLSFEKTKRNNPLKFEIEFGYICDESQNVIYFQLFETSEKPKILFDDFLEEREQSIPNEWEKGIWGETNDNIYVQFSLDETLSEEKINDLFNVFKEHILLPTIKELK